MELAVVMEERCICSIFEPPESLCEQQRKLQNRDLLVFTETDTAGR